MAYIVQQPCSNSNPTNEYRVIWADDWIKYVNGSKRWLPIVGSFDNYAEAELLRDALNS